MEEGIAPRSCGIYDCSSFMPFAWDGIDTPWYQALGNRKPSLERVMILMVGAKDWCHEFTKPATREFDRSSIPRIQDAFGRGGTSCFHALVLSQSCIGRVFGESRENGSVSFVGGSLVKLAGLGLFDGLRRLVSHIIGPAPMAPTERSWLMKECRGRATCQTRECPRLHLLLLRRRLLSSLSSSRLLVLVSSSGNFNVT